MKIKVNGKEARHTYDIDPFLKSLHKAHPRDLEALLAAAATAEEVVARAEYSEAAARTLLVFARYEYLVEVVVVERVRVVYAVAEVLGVRQGALVFSAWLAGSGVPHHGEVRLPWQRRHTHLLHAWRCLAFNNLLLLRLHVFNISVVAERAVLLEIRNQVLSFHGRPLMAGTVWPPVV